MKIVHLSDLHYGTQRAPVESKLRAAIGAIAPDLIVVSGDFTQRALESEFEQARAFMDSLKTPYFAVPGNHDIPAYNLFDRFFAPYNLYQTHITQDLCPVDQSHDALIVGVNTARRALPHWNWANGAISARQCERMEHIFKTNAPAQWNICVMHHPICFNRAQTPLNVTVFGRKRALKALSRAGVDLVLTGHTHHAGITTQASDVNPADKIIHVGASTALSSRLRKQANGFNLIELSGSALRVLSFVYDESGFQISNKFEYKK